MSRQWTAGWTNVDPQNTDQVTAVHEVETPVLDNRELAWHTVAGLLIVPWNVLYVVF